MSNYKEKLALIKQVAEDSLEFNITAEAHAAVLGVILKIIEFGEGGE